MAINSTRRKWFAEPFPAVEQAAPRPAPAPAPVEQAHPASSRQSLLVGAAMVGGRRSGAIPRQARSNGGRWR